MCGDKLAPSQFNNVSRNLLEKTDHPRKQASLDFLRREKA